MTVFSFQVWKRIRNAIDSKSSISGDLLDQALERGEDLEKLQRLVLQYREALESGQEALTIRRAIFKVSRELKG